MAPALDPGLANLLDVQAEDNAAEAGRRRLEALPERQVLAARQREIDALDAEIAELTAPRREIERRLARLEDEAAGLRAKAHEAEATMYSGRVSALRELQALQDEVAALNRRASVLEDEVLELMVDIEGRREGEAELLARREALETAAREATVALAEAEAREQAELDAIAARRGAAAGSVPPDALAEYERQRPHFGFATVVRLVGARCEGCPLAIPAVEADRIRRSEPGMATCGECGRLVLHG